MQKNANITISQTLPNATITQAGNITRVACTVNGYSVLTTASAINPHFCSGTVNANGTKAFSSGRYDSTVAHSTGSGNYFINYTGATYPSTHYVVITTAIGIVADAGVGADHNTSRAHIYTWITNTGVLFDSEFFLHCIEVNLMVKI